MVRCGMVRDVVQCGAVLSSGHGVMCMQCTCSVHVVYMWCACGVHVVFTSALVGVGCVFALVGVGCGCG